MKDTHVGFLGEAGLVEFRAEVFNFLNHPDFAAAEHRRLRWQPTDLGLFSEKPGQQFGHDHQTTEYSKANSARFED